MTNTRLTEQTLELKKRLKEKYKDREIKCIADEIWLYCRYMFDDIDGMVRSNPGIMDSKYVVDKETKEQLYNKLEELYKNIRGETFYQGKKTASYAGGIFYIVCMLHGVNMTQPVICQKLHISAVGLRHAYQELIAFYRKEKNK